MKRIVTDLPIVFVLLLGCSIRLPAQRVTADRFLKGVSSRPAGDQVEVGEGGEIYQALNNDSPAEVQRQLPSILQYALAGNEVHARKYAALFLTAIAMRPDGAALLFSSSAQISSLILDDDSGIQKAAVSVALWAGPNQQRYVSAFEAAIERAQTPQDIDVQMVSSLAKMGSGNPEALKAVLDFLHRDNLTASTRSQLVHLLGAVTGLPQGVNQALVKELDDPDPGVRAAAVASFADSKTEYHDMAKDRIASMANDPQENPKVRELAHEALAGQKNLNPNVMVPNAEMPPDKPNDH